MRTPTVRSILLRGRVLLRRGLGGDGRRRGNDLMSKRTIQSCRFLFYVPAYVLYIGESTSYYQALFLRHVQGLIMAANVERFIAAIGVFTVPV